jgi:hypothetical protein
MYRYFERMRRERVPLCFFIWTLTRKRKVKFKIMIRKQKKTQNRICQKRGSIRREGPEFRPEVP